VKCANQDGSSVLFNLQATNNGYATYSWQIIGPSYNQTFSGNNSFNQISVPLSNNGSYNVTLTVNGTASITQINYLTLNALPSITINVPATVCQNNSSNYTLNISPATYNSLSTSIGASTYNSTSFNHPFSSSGSQTITTTVIGTNGCQSTKIENVNVLQSPVLTSSTSPSAVCSGSNFVYNPTTNPSAGVTWSWNRLANASISTPVSSGNSGINEILTNSTSSATTVSYQFVLSSTLNSCQTTQGVSVSILPKPQISISPASATVCSGQATTLLASGGQNYSWTPNTQINTTTGPQVIVTPTVTRTYTVTATSNTVPACSASQQVTITVANPPILTGPQPNTASMCSAGVLSVPLTADAAGSTFQWYALNNSNVTNATNISGPISSSNINNSIINLCWANRIVPIVSRYSSSNV
jgi:hypothetical protein